MNAWIKHSSHKFNLPFLFNLYQILELMSYFPFKKSSFNNRIALLTFNGLNFIRLNTKPVT